MAKGLRSSVKKANKSKLRSLVFGPVEDARTQRLSAKLLELASPPKAGKSAESRMDIETEDEMLDEGTTKEKRVQTEEDLVMEDGGTSSLSKSSKKRSPSKIVKQRRRKPRNTLVFPGLKKRKQGAATRR